MCSQCGCVTECERHIYPNRIYFLIDISVECMCIVKYMFYLSVESLSFPRRWRRSLKNPDSCRPDQISFAIKKVNIQRRTNPFVHTKSLRDNVRIVPNEYYYYFFFPHALYTHITCFSLSLCLSVLDRRSFYHIQEHIGIQYARRQ